MSTPAYPDLYLYTNEAEDVAVAIGIVLGAHARFSFTGGLVMQVVTAVDIMLKLSCLWRFCLVSIIAVPLWLQVLLGITAVTAALLLLTCLVLCCMRLCGCWTGNILGVGSLRRPMDDTDHIGCWCCRPAVVTADGSYVTQWRNTSRRSTPIKPEGVWMPHTNPVRNNNQSTQ